MFVVAIIPEGRSDPCPHSLRGSGRGGAGLLSEDPAPCAYVLGKWLRRERQRPSIRLRAYPPNTTICVRPPPGGEKGLRSHSHASTRAIYTRRCSRARPSSVDRPTPIGAKHSGTTRADPRTRNHEE